MPLICCNTFPLLYVDEGYRSAEMLAHFTGIDKNWVIIKAGSNGKCLPLNHFLERNENYNLIPPLHSEPLCCSIQ